MGIPSVRSHEPESRAHPTEFINATSCGTQTVSTYIRPRRITQRFRRPIRPRRVRVRPISNDIRYVWNSRTGSRSRVLLGHLPRSVERKSSSDSPLRACLATPQFSGHARSIHPACNHSHQDGATVEFE